MLYNISGVFREVDTERCPPPSGRRLIFWHATIATYGEEMDLLHAGRVKCKVREILSITVGHTTHREMLRLIQILMG